MASQRHVYAFEMQCSIFKNRKQGGILLQLYLAAPPEQLHTARKYTNYLAHAAYRIGPGGSLTARTLPQPLRGGLMMLSDREAEAIPDTHRLCREILRECGRRSYSGVTADFEEPVSADRAALLEQLEVLLRMNRRILFVPEAYGAHTVSASVVIDTALSGGTLQGRLKEAADRYGGARLALDLERMAMDFPLPSPSGMGKPLATDQLSALLAQNGQCSFFSSDLCARYFTYQRAGQSHFVLYDDAETLQRKIQAGQALGIRTGFFMLPEVEDLLASLYPKKTGT